MRPALAAAVLLLTALAAVPAQGAVLPAATVVSGGGTGVAFAGCEKTVAIAFAISFELPESPVVFAGPGCDDGPANTWVNDCRQVPSGILCDGSYEDEGFLSIGHDGTFHYERPYGDHLFTVDGQVAFDQLVVPALV